MLFFYIQFLLPPVLLFMQSVATIHSFFFTIFIISSAWFNISCCVASSSLNPCLSFYSLAVYIVLLIIKFTWNKYLQKPVHLPSIYGSDQKVSTVEDINDAAWESFQSQLLPCPKYVFYLFPNMILNKPKYVFTYSLYFSQEAFHWLNLLSNSKKHFLIQSKNWID